MKFLRRIVVTDHFDDKRPPLGTFRTAGRGMPASDWLKAAVATLTLSSFPAAAQTAADILIRHVHGRGCRARTHDSRSGHCHPRQQTSSPSAAMPRLQSPWKAAQTLDASDRLYHPRPVGHARSLRWGVELIDENQALLPLYVAHGITTVRRCVG
jgi:hypothetical protein